MRNEEIESLYWRIDILEECVKVMAERLQVVEIGHVTAAEIVEAIESQDPEVLT